ncbi:MULTISPECIES: hypothetical protein [Corynebacterium]|uniref:hypothetical protein n=1 Tax=Corynebacterium TaxID=1716 RepID=UPI0008A436AB|nr:MULTISPECIES: hypothetical protein [Corynebacterium]MCT1563122.1 hypothetical protein [Corynebacterium glucuronolyticum]OFO42638.1 hypothetical protein HMPREF3044_05505 [Corynebacterium sp. HMSC073D01]
MWRDGGHGRAARLDVLQKLGFTQNPKVQDLKSADSGFSIQLSAEQLDTIVAAFPIFIDTAQLTDDPSWNKVPAAADGRAFVVDGDIASAFSLGIPEATTYAIEKLTPMIEQATK